MGGGLREDAPAVNFVTELHYRVYWARSCDSRARSDSLDDVFENHRSRPITVWYLFQLVLN